MNNIRNSIFLICSILSFAITNNGFAQCNTNSIVCDNNALTGPFNFTSASNNPSSCLDFLNGATAPNYAYITVYVSSAGELNLLVDGDGTTGFLDVSVFDITNLSDPCSQMSTANELSCNYASSSSGCAQFGTEFGCPASVAAPQLQAGDVIMILVEDWSDNHNDFTLELADTPSTATTDIPDATIDNVAPLCLSDAPIQLSAANNGGTWSGPGVSSTGEFDPGAAGVGTHTITYNIGTAPCLGSDQIDITVNQGVQVTAETDNGTDQITICEGETTTLSAFDVDSYSWDNGLGAGSNQTVSPTTTTMYTVTGVDLNGCETTEELTVNVSPNVTITTSNDDTICHSSSTDISATASGGSSFTYHWGHTSNNDGVQTVSPTTQTIYTVYAENEFGCESPSESIEIDVWEEPDLSIVNDVTICPGESVNLSAQGSNGAGAPFNYSWVDDAGNNVGSGMDITVSPAATTTYTVELLDQCGTLPVQKNITVTVAPIPTIDFSVVDDKICTPAQFELTNDTDAALTEETYWYISDGQTFINSDNLNLSIDQSGTYDVKLVVITPDGCIDSLTKQDFLTVYPKPVAKFNFYPDPVTMLNTEVAFQNYSTGASTYEWSFEGGDPGYSSLEDPVSFFPEGEVDNYDVEMIATSIYDCKDTARAIVQVESEVIIYAPNAFTPDGDEHNQNWRVYIEGINIQDFDLEIYNRWGELVWESHDPSASWDGTYGVQSGKLVPEGTYIWKIRARDMINDDKYEWQGHVTIIY